MRLVGRGVKAGSLVTLYMLRSAGGVVVELIITFFLRLLRGRLVLVDMILFGVISNSLSPVAIMSDAPVVVSRVLFCGHHVSNTIQQFAAHIVQDTVKKLSFVVFQWSDLISNCLFTPYKSVEILAVIVFISPASCCSKVLLDVLISVVAELSASL